VNSTSIHREVLEGNGNDIKSQVIKDVIELNLLLFNDAALGTDTQHVG
jgi:hypothetical protein